MMRSAVGVLRREAAVSVPDIIVKSPLVMMHRPQRLCGERVVSVVNGNIGGYTRGFGGVVLIGVCDCYSVLIIGDDGTDSCMHDMSVCCRCDSIGASGNEDRDGGVIIGDDSNGTLGDDAPAAAVVIREVS